MADEVFHFSPTRSRIRQMILERDEKRALREFAIQQAGCLGWRLDREDACDLEPLTTVMVRKLQFAIRDNTSR